MVEREVRIRIVAFGISPRRSAQFNNCEEAYGGGVMYRIRLLVHKDTKGTKIA